MRCTAGKIAVAVHITREPDEGLLQDNDIGNKGRTDVGTIISSGDERYPAGSVAILLPKWGKYIRNLRSSGYVYGEVRLLGDAGMSGRQDLYDVGRAVVALVDGMRIKPKYGRILVKRDPCISSYGSLVLPDTVGDRTGMSTVLEVCDSVSDLKPGDRVCCHAGSYDRATLGREFGEYYECDSKDLAFAYASSVYYVEEPQEQAA